MLDAATLPAPAHPHERLDLSEQVRHTRAEEPVTYRVVLPLSRRVVQHVADLLQTHHEQLLTRPGRRSLSLDSPRRCG